MLFEPSIVVDFAVIMTVAAIVYLIFYKLRQPTILGYLVAGVLIGPYTPPFALITDLNTLSTTADLGVILLLFGIGLQFPLTKLKRVGGVSAGVAGIEIAVMLLLSFGIGWILHWPLMDSLFLGAALASSSTAIIAKVLADLGKIKDHSAIVMLGVLVVEDLVVVGLLAVITSVVDTGSVTFTSLFWLAAKMTALILGTLILSIFVVPKIIERTLRVGNNEFIILVVLGFCFGFSVITNLMGFSLAMGAFLAGIACASAKSVEKIESVISPLKDMFAAIFFVSVGALIDIGQFQNYWLPALLITALMIGGKLIGCGLGTRVCGYDSTTSFRVGLGMCQIGEFAFIVMKAGQSLNVISPFLFPVVGAAAAVTTFLTPYFIKLSYRIDLNKVSLFWKKRFGK
jgi:monovalent cation:H+ antiporter-2, CPA2 family